MRNTVYLNKCTALCILYIPIILTVGVQSEAGLLVVVDEEGRAVQAGPASITDKIK
jgi:hypothetical protein